MPCRIVAPRAAAVAVALTLLSTATAVAAPSGWLALDGSIRSLTGVAGDWANSGTGPPAGCPAGAVDVGGAGGLFNCGAPGAAGAPPSPPALTPAAAADPSIISHVFIVDPISSDTTSCPTAGDNTVIAGSGKNGDPINSYTLTTQSVPPKDDLGNVYAVSHTRADNGHPELYFGAERLVNNGDSHIDFEFLQDQLTITSADPNGCAGAFGVPQVPPCAPNCLPHRTEGDLLATVDFTVGGTVAGIVLYQWHCAAEPGPQPADGTVCDPVGATPPQHYESIGVPPAISFLVNAADVPCGGWVCRDKITGNSTQVAARDFLEGGIDLLALPFVGCFNTFLPHTRTAQSFSSTLKDFTGPALLLSCRNPNTVSASTGGGGSLPPGSSVNDTATVASPAGFSPTGTVAFFLCATVREEVTAAGCPSGGLQVGASKTLSAGIAASDPTSDTTGFGRYCWRTEYTPDQTSQGVYLASIHTNATTECFTVPTPSTPGLPATGAPATPLGAPPQPFWLAVACLAAAGLVSGLAWARRRR